MTRTTKHLYEEIDVSNEPVSKPTTMMNPFAASSDALTTSSLPEYLLDAFQRSVLFLELLRERGNKQIEITSQPQATVLRYDHEILISGRSLPKPINYYLARIRPPAGVALDPNKRPVVVVDALANRSLA